MNKLKFLPDFLSEANKIKKEILEKKEKIKENFIPIRISIHTLKGNSGMMEFTTLYELCKIVERTMKKIIAKKLTITDSMVNNFKISIEQIAKEVELIESSGKDNYNGTKELIEKLKKEYSNV